MSQKVVVFGGAGFVGSHVADALSDAGYQVFLFDKKTSIYLREDQEMILGDLLDEEAVKLAVKGAAFVYNFSGEASLDLCAKEPQLAVQNNIVAHTNLLQACADAEVKRLVYASSVYVYSNQGSFYKITKQTCENLTEEYAKNRCLDFTILRYGSLYGPRAQDWNGLQKYLKQAVEEGRVDYPGSGDERREYIHVLDAARMSVKILEEEFVNKHITITGRDSLTSRELLQMISEMLNNKVEVSLNQSPQFHHYKMTPYSFTPRVGMKLSPNPSIDMGEGMLRQIEEIHQKKESNQDEASACL